MSLDINWRRRAAWIERAAACSFLLSAAVTLSVYATWKRPDAWPIYPAQCLALIGVPCELLVAAAATSFAWNVWRLRRRLRDVLPGDMGPAMRHGNAQALFTVMTAWPLAGAVTAAFLVCSHMAAAPAGIRLAVSEAFGLLTIFLGLHWFQLGIYKRLTPILLACRQLPVPRRAPM